VEEDLMEVIPVAFDSMGARGMSCLVHTKGESFMIDPGVNLGPRRHKLPPHPLEEEKKSVLWKRIEKEIKKVQTVILTHYHYDHLNPEAYHVFFGKRVILKHPHDNLNYNQQRRASLLLDSIKGKSSEIIFADGARRDFKDLNLTFSDAVPHGLDTKRGCVVQVVFEEPGCRFLFTSDVEGANLDSQLMFILKHNPDILLLDGPAITFPKSRSHRICEIIEKTDVKTLIVDHHIMREENWREYIQDAIDLAKEKGVRLVSAAGYRGEGENLLEARRVDLFREFPIP
jgi:predicted metallo-beta-lactamase superfamily hydrolase